MSSANTPIFPSIDKPWMKHLSKRAKGLQVPEGTMFDQIYENNKDYPNELALKYMDIQVTFAEMWEHIEEVVKALNALGVREGEIITIAMPNTPEFVYLAYAINRVGAVMNIIHPLPGKEELLGYLEEAQSRYFFMFDGTYAIIKDDLKNTSVEKAIVVSPAYSLAPIKRKLYQLAKFPKLDKTMCIDWKAFLKNGVNSPATTGKTDSDAMAVISHTGGTTGEPKGVMLTNRAMNSVAYQVWQTFDLADRRQLTILVVLPPFVNYSFVNGIHEGLTMAIHWHCFPSSSRKILRTTINNINRTSSTPSLSTVSPC